MSGHIYTIKSEKSPDGYTQYKVIVADHIVLDFNVQHIGKYWYVAVYNPETGHFDHSSAGYNTRHEAATDAAERYLMELRHATEGSVA